MLLLSPDNCFYSSLYLSFDWTANKPNTAGELSSFPVLIPSSCLFSLWRYLHTFQILDSVKHNFLGISFSSWAVFSGGSKWTIILQELRCHLAIGNPWCTTNTSRTHQPLKKRKTTNKKQKKSEKRSMLHPMPMFASIFFFSFCPAVKPQLSLYNDINPYSTGWKNFPFSFEFLIFRVRDYGISNFLIEII